MDTRFAKFSFGSDENQTDAALAEKRVLENIKRLKLERHAAELDTQGYTILSPSEVGDPVLVTKLRDKLLSIAESRFNIKADLEKGFDTAMNESWFGSGVYMKNILYEDPMFEKVILSEKPLALATYLLGESCKLSHMSATIKDPGDEFLELHVDAVGSPAPLTPYACQANATWILTDYSRELGGTCFVPGSHKWCRFPTPQEGKEIEKFEPINAEAGSILIWGGNTWHGSVPRTLPGLRVSLMAFYVRWNFYTVDDDMKFRVTQEMLDRNPPRFRKLVGFDLPANGKNPDNPLIKTMAETQYNRFA